MRTISFIITAAISLLASNLFSQEKHLAKDKPVKTYQTHRLTTLRPVINGNLDDPCWEEGKWTGNFIQWTPNEGAQPSCKTEAKILYDNKNIYVAIRLFDKNPSQISIKASPRDQLSGDMAGIAFDSYHDHRTGFEFDVSAFGQKTDMVMTNPIVCDFNWNAVWKCKTGLEDSAWVAEFEIPFSQLRYSNEPEQIWGLHIWRWIDRYREESDWEPLTLTGPGLIYQFGHLTGLKDLPKLKRMELIPYAMGRLKTFEKQAENPFARKGTKWISNFGLDAKIGLSSNFTADLTINPDFGQVEADPSQMNMTAFETFFEEKRPFFLEGTNIFKFDFDGVNLFYSRRIGHEPTFKPKLKVGEYLESPVNTSILGAVKISGKTVNGLSIGLMQSLSNKEMANLWTGSETVKTTVEPMTNYTVLRVQQDFNEGTTNLGGIITSTNRITNESKFDLLPQNAFSSGMDLFHQWNNKKYFLMARLIGSFVDGSKDGISLLQRSPAHYFQRPDLDYVHLDTTKTSLSGFGGQLSIGKESQGFWRYSIDINWRSPGLELNDLGFMHLADIINLKNNLSYFVNKPVFIFRTFSFSLNEISNWDFGLNYLSSSFTLGSRFEFKNKWGINQSYSYTPEAKDNRLLRGKGSIKVPSTKSLFIQSYTDQSKQIIFILNSAYKRMASGAMNSWSITPQLSFQPISTLKFYTSINYARNINELQYVATIKATAKYHCVLGRIDQKELGAVFRVDYNLTPELSIQYYGSPFISMGKYDHFKIITDPTNDDYKKRYKEISPTFCNNNYTFIQDSGSEDSFNNPDFDFSQFRSNFVFRWEYRQGSVFHLVWSNERTFSNSNSIGLRKAIEGLHNVFPKNLFLMKWTYWISI